MLELLRTLLISVSTTPIVVSVVDQRVLESSHASTRVVTVTTGVSLVGGPDP